MIGELSRLTGVNIETIRYYERVGVMPKPSRSDGGHRFYDNEHMKRLAFVKRSRELGFGLDDIRELLGLVDGGSFTCAEVHTITTSHLDDVKRKIADLRRMERVLKSMAAECSQGDLPDCPIIDTLSRSPNF
jgi:MerR family mercuric resistance operon transcriptional regulator